MENNLILSICIPTYNRAIYLEKTIHSIVNQKRFQETEDVEIVISDNCSEDNTEDISRKYTDIYGQKIRYYRTQTTINAGANLEKVLSLGKGVFLKSNNDTLIHHEDTLNRIIEVINQNIDNKDIIFFSNGTLKNTTQLHCDDLNSFIKNVSFYSTWIICFGIWKKDFEKIDNFNTIAKTLLINDVLFQLISLKKSVFIDNTKIFDTVNAKSKGGYNIYQVFVTNYLGTLEKYKKKNQISRITLFNEKSKLLIHFLIPWTLILLGDKTNYTFDQRGALSIIFKKYRFHPIFYISVAYLFLRKLQYGTKIRLWTNNIILF